MEAGRLEALGFDSGYTCVPLSGDRLCGNCGKPGHNRRTCLRRYSRFTRAVITAPNMEDNTEPYHKMQDVEREEEPWGVSQEELIKRWRESSNSLATAHDTGARVCKKKNVLYGLPSLMIPMLMAPLSAALKDNEYISYIEMLAFMATAITSAMSQFFDFSSIILKIIQQILI